MALNVKDTVIQTLNKKKMINYIENLQKISSSMRELGGRTINLPEVLTEGILCSIFGFIRINKQGSFDCFDEKNSQTIEVKSTQLTGKDATSFSPKIFLWDILYFMDFSEPNYLKVYAFVKEELSQVKVSSSQSIKDQQKQRGRPRFSLKNLIELYKKQPVYECRLI